MGWWGVVREADDKEAKCLDAVLGADRRDLDDLFPRDGFPAHVFLNGHFRALHSKIDSIAARRSHSADSFFREAVGACFTLSLEHQAAPRNFLANLHDPLLAQGKHEIAEKNVLKPKGFDQLLNFIHKILRVA